MENTDSRSVTTEGYVWQITQGPEAGGYARFFQTQGHLGSRHTHCNSSSLADATVFPRDKLSDAESHACPYYVTPIRCVRTTTSVTTLHPDAA